MLSVWGSNSLLARDRIILYTDGMIEATCGDQEYGLERLLEVAASLRHLPSEQIISALFQDLESFCLDKKAEDDRTVVVVKFPTADVPLSAASGEA